MRPSNPRLHKTVEAFIAQSQMTNAAAEYYIWQRERIVPDIPDMVFPRLRKVIEIRGCFWHGNACRRCRIPATRRAYWLAKMDRNRRRDRRTIRQLRRLG